MSLFPVFSPVTGPAFSIEQVTSAASNASDGTITCPTVQAGDLIVLWDFAANIDEEGNPANVVPSGFSQVNTHAGTDLRATLSYKLATGTESGATITGMDGSSLNRKLIVTFRRDPVATGVTVGGAVGTIANGNPDPQTLESGGIEPPLIAIFCYGCATSFVDPRDFTPAKDGEISASVERIYLAWKFFTDGPGEQVVADMGDEGEDNTISGFYARMTA